jgi:hypothetical protein
MLVTFSVGSQAKVQGKIAGFGRGVKNSLLLKEKT